MLQRVPQLRRKKPLTVFIIGGTRPNFVKIAALSCAFEIFRKSHPGTPFRYQLVNTGQHYDYLMSKKFFQELHISDPSISLGVGSSSHADQTAKIMVRLEKVFLRERPDLVVVVGDVNSTLASSLVAAKMGISVAHVEAGLRSFDRSMPEEINRIVTDALSDFLFTTCRDADKNLEKEGISKEKIFFVGNVMVDTLFANLKRADRSPIQKELGLRNPYAVLTLHRPSNVDLNDDFLEILKALEAIQKRIPIVFPVHPRTSIRLKKGSLTKRLNRLKNLYLTPPLGYLDFIKLMKEAKFVLTDSGGIQEETTVLGIPCLTLRDNTERPITIELGTNVLVGRKSEKIVEMAFRAMNGRARKEVVKPPLWDGKAAYRIVKVLSRKLGF